MLQAMWLERGPVTLVTVTSMVTGRSQELCLPSLWLL